MKMENTCRQTEFYVGNPFTIVNDDLITPLTYWNLCADIDVLQTTGLCQQSLYTTDPGITPIFVAIPTTYYQHSVSCQQPINPVVGGLPSPVTALQCNKANPESEYAVSSYCDGISIINGYTSQRDCYFAGDVIYACNNSDNIGCGAPGSYISLNQSLSEFNVSDSTPVTSTYGGCNNQLYCGWDDVRFNCITPPEIPIPPPPPPPTVTPTPQLSPQQIRVLMVVAMIVVVIIGIVLLGLIILLTR